MSDQETTDTTQDTETVHTGHDEDNEEFSFVEDPTFEVDYKGDCAYEVKVSVPAANEK